MLTIHTYLFSEVVPLEMFQILQVPHVTAVEAALASACSEEAAVESKNIS